MRIHRPQRLRRGPHRKIIKKISPISDILTLREEGWCDWAVDEAEDDSRIADFCGVEFMAYGLEDRDVDGVGLAVDFDA